MVPRPIVAVVSEDEVLIQQLAGELADSFELIVRSTSRELQDSLWDFRPQVLVVDARRATDGGHAIVRLLDSAEAHGGKLDCILLRSAACPEPVERRIACSKIGQLHDPVDVAAIAERILQRRFGGPPLAARDDRFASAPLQHPCHESAVQNVIRRFETRSTTLKAMLADLAVAADHDVTILLVGETGSGKTFLSRLIHETSSRRNEPFLHVACGALPRDLIESELFGHAKGAFTSAYAEKDGKFLAAGQGTVLLDEIDVLGPEQQVKLLRVIETGEFEPVGSNQTLRSQARLVVASNLELQPLVDQGRFRPDLYYRLNMLKFPIPPLRKRRVDIVPLAKQFIRKFQEKHRTPILRIEDSLLDALVGYSWPGNVRELENVIHRAVIYCRDGILSARQLPEHVVASAAQQPSIRLEASRPPGGCLLGRQIAMTERDIIEEALQQNDHSKTKTAKALGISRVTLYNKLKKLEISN